jgi:hypothetical protein
MAAGAAGGAVAELRSVRLLVSDRAGRADQRAVADAWDEWAGARAGTRAAEGRGGGRGGGGEGPAAVVVSLELVTAWGALPGVGALVGVEAEAQVVLPAA